MGFFAKNNQKELLFHIQLEVLMSEVCKAQTNDLKTFPYVLIGPIRVSEAKVFPMIISNSGKRKSEKNSFVNFLKKRRKITL